MSDERNSETAAPFPRRIGIQANAAGFVEVHFQYQGALLAVAMPVAEARELSAHLVSYADAAEKAIADAAAAAEKAEQEKAAAAKPKRKPRVRVKDA
jgi:hypothetical protein